MENIIVIFVVVAILALAAGYVYRTKKKGQRCIGCPDGGCRASGEGACAGCTGGCSCK